MREGSKGIFLSNGQIGSGFNPRVTSIVGHEQLGSLYEYRITFALEQQLKPDELDALLTKPCQFWVEGDALEQLSGVIREVELLDSTEGHDAVYVVVVMPTVWMLTLSRVSRVYQNLTVLDIAREILTRFGLTADRDFDFRIFATYEKRELYVQYEESDWAFLERWFEREGVYYWFEHGEAGDKLVVFRRHQGRHADRRRRDHPLPRSRQPHAHRGEHLRVGPGEAPHRRQGGPQGLQRAQPRQCR